MALARAGRVEMSVIFLPGQHEPIPAAGLAPGEKTGSLRNMMSGKNYDLAVRALAATSIHFLHSMSLKPNTPVRRVSGFVRETGFPNITHSSNLTPFVDCLRRAVPVRAVLQQKPEWRIRSAYFLRIDTPEAQRILEESDELASLRPWQTPWVRDTIGVIPLDIRNRWATNELTIEDEGRLVEMMQQGRSQTAFDIVYGQTYPRIISHLESKLHGDQETAKLIADEVFARVTASIDRYQPRGCPFISWIFRIATNAFIDHSRKPVAVSLDRKDPQDEVLDIPTGTDWISQSLDSITLAKAAEGLTPLQKEVIHNRYFLDQSILQTAAIMHTSEDAIKQLTFKALRRMRKALADPN